MCRSNDNISEVYHKYPPDISRPDWRTHLCLTSRRWIKCAGMRDARCLMHAVSPLRYVGGVENWIGNSDRYSGTRRWRCSLICRCPDPETRVLLPRIETTDSFDRSVRLLSKLYAKRQRRAILSSRHLMPNPWFSSRTNLGRIECRSVCCIDEKILFPLLAEYSFNPSVNERVSKQL